MESLSRFSLFAITVLLLVNIPVIASADTLLPDSSITYTITIAEDGIANWHVEYRTLLISDADRDAFDSYAKNMSSVYLPQFQDLMQRSAAQASAATFRHMETSDFTGETVIQTTPTGTYGVVYYSFSWKNFAQTGPNLAMGDAFAGGLYLAKDNTLVIRYPSGYTVSAAEPAPDQVRDGLIWYGQRSFGAGAPRLVFEKPGIPWLPLLAGGFLVLVVVVAGLYMILSKRRSPEPVETDYPPVTLSETELLSLEERIIQLLKSSGGEHYQSEIVKNLGLPKSTVSATLNDLHQRGIIQKIKKGRENLIRLK
jgi:uncharacterized membrane protein